MGQIIVAIDIGTSKVCTVIGRLDSDNQLEILGKGISPCSGLKKGVIVDIESTSISIRSSVAQAESMAGLKVASAYANIAGTHVSVIHNRASLDISGDTREVTRKDVEKVLDLAQSVSIPGDRQIIDVIPKQYVIDGYDEILDPVGMVGVTLEADVDIVAGKITSVQNIVKSVERAGVKINGIVVEGFSTGELVLLPEEKEMGVMLVDIGGSITDVSIYRNRRLVFYDSIPVGGDHITNDISIGLKVSPADAEKLKREYKLALVSLIKNDQSAAVMDMELGRKKSVLVSDLVEIIEARLAEIFSLCQEISAREGFSEGIYKSLVLCGKGVSHFDGCLELGEEIFSIPVRLASSRSAGLTDGACMTAAGIVRYLSAQKRQGAPTCDVKDQSAKCRQEKPGFGSKLLRLLKSLF